MNYVEISNDSWQWAEDYAYLYATYVVACPPGRECEVGMGINAFGEPRGEKLPFSHETEITLIGIGALYFRVKDGRGQCRVGFARKDSLGLGYTWKWD